MMEDSGFEGLRTGGFEGPKAETWDLKIISAPANHPVSGFPLS
jgi:hypothetical protein